MTDLNLAATVTGSTSGAPAWQTPQNANDGNGSTAAGSPPHLTSGTVTRTLTSDLGSAQLVDSMTIQGSWNTGSAATDPEWSVEHSADGSSWSPATGVSYSWDQGTVTAQISFDAETKQYWRIVWSRTFSGLSYDAWLMVLTWQIFEGTPPDPPPPPTAGTSIDWDDDGFSVGDYDDVTAFVGYWTIRRGSGPRIIDSADIGTLSLTLINVDPADPDNPANPLNDQFNPANTSGPLYGKLRDGHAIHVSVNADGAATGDDPRGLFAGYITRITPQPQPGATFAPTVVIEAEDALGWYRRTKLQVTDLVGRSHQRLRFRMLEAAGENRISLANEILTMPLSSWDGDLLSGLEAINKVNGTRHFIEPQDNREAWYLYTTRNRQYRLDGTVDFTIDASSDHATSTDWGLDADTVVNQQKATVEPVTFSPSSRVVWRGEGLPWGITHSRPKHIWIEFDDYVADPVVEYNSTGGSLTVTLTSFGHTAKLDIETATMSAGTVTSIVVRGALARRGTAVSVQADDTASQAGTRGVRAGSEIDGDFVGVEANAQGICDHIVWRYADATFRPAITVVNWLPYQFDVNPFDTLAATIAELQIDGMLFEVVGLEHRGELAHSADVKSHTATFYLQQSRVQTDPGWFVLDSSHLDGDDVLAY